MLLSFVNSSRYVMKKHTVGKILAKMVQPDCKQRGVFLRMYPARRLLLFESYSALFAAG